MQNDNTFLGTERIGKLLFRLALPAVTAQLVNMLYNLVDRIYIGHIPETGSLALTGMGVCMPLIMLISAFLGREKTLELYNLAVKNRYRFFSFGDAMLLL